MLNRLRRVVVCLLLSCSAVVSADDKPPQKCEMAGYLLVPHARVDARKGGRGEGAAARPLCRDPSWDEILAHRANG
jgi:hypothetical protein